MSAYPQTKPLQTQRRAPIGPEQQKQLATLQVRMRRVKNQMDFAEILSNFLPMGNLERLDNEMNQLNQQYTRILSGTATPFKAS